MKLIPHWEYLSWARDRFGVAFALLTYWRALFGLHVRIRVSPNDYVYLRAGTTDLAVYDEVFRIREYAVDVGDPEFIVDAGAHIGLSTAYLALRYPKAKIVAIELDPRNFALLQKNVRAFRNVVAVHAGLWSRSTGLRVSNPDAATWSYRAEEGNDVRGMTVQDILSAFGVERIDLFKIDIEGGEKDLLEHSTGWIDRVRAIVIETHDRYVAGCTQVLERAIRGQGFVRSTSGESVVLVRPEALGIEVQEAREA